MPMRLRLPRGYRSALVRRLGAILALVSLSGGAAPDAMQDELFRVTASSNADAYAPFRAYGRLEARTLWDGARGKSPTQSSTSPAFEKYRQFHAYAATLSRQAKETFFKGRYDRSRARLPENVEQWRSEPDIANPGPDLANFPNSAFTLPQGRAYVELSPLTYYGSASAGSPAQYNAEFLLRYGATDDIELRLFSNGPSWIGGAHPSWGFSPIAFDTKINLWLEKQEYFLPAAGFEAYLLTQWLGSAPFNGGTQPSFTMLFDQSLPFEIDLEYNIGITRVQDQAGQNVWEFSFQWALQRDFFSKDFALFIHGFYNAEPLSRVPRATQPVNVHGDASQDAVGAGFVWTINRRLALYGQVSGGTTRFTPQSISTLGLAVSF
jgi:hypothetical protein